MRKIFLLSVCLAMCSAGALHALVVDSAELNGTAPENGAPWNNVGRGNGASAVYLKNGWVISARHVFGGSTSAQVSFGGTIFSSGTVWVLTNPNKSPSDVVLFNIGTTHPTGSSEIGVAISTPAENTNFTMIGYGSRRAGDLMDIQITGGMAKGYYWDGLGGVNKSWGAAICNSAALGYAQAPPYNKFIAIQTTFSATGNSGISQAALGDSGGAVFFSNNGVWELSGTMNAIGQQVANAATDGDITAIANMASYAVQINAKLTSGIAAPVLTSVSPSTFAAQNDSRTLTFSGSKFVNRAKVQISYSADFNNFSDTTPNAVFVSSTSMTLTVTAQAPATWKFRVVNPDGQPSAAVTVTVNPQTFSNWISNYPSLTGNNALATADPDGDGAVNLLEYAFGSDPTTSAIANLPVAAAEVVSSQTYLTLTYQKDTTRSDITYQGQSSTDLTAPWIDVSDVLVSSSGTLQQRKISVLRDGTAKFLRVKITK